ncbi:MAG: serine/threonine protein kinase, partial [Planctomycetes bacterium]|nr:serine/threonine protein kinase [Planctomycetota bacterium]
MPPAPAFGQVAIEKGYLTEEKLADALRLQKKLKEMGLRETLGEILVKKGYLTRDQIHEILRVQGTRSGTLVPGYDLLEKLGAGGMGSVFKARQVSMDRLVAIKILAPHYAAQPEYRERFLREGRMAARLNHPNVVAAYDVGSNGSNYYLVMEFVDGTSLQDRIRKEGRIGQAEALEYWIQIGRALDHAGKSGLIHRDVKPANILVEASGRAKLADLGLARPVDDQDAELTDDGTALGTPFYISPEQARGVRDLDIRTDIYSLGASFYHVLTGKPVFDGPSAAVILTRHLRDVPVPPETVCPDLAPELSRIALRCLVKEREGRFASPARLIEALESARRSMSGEGEQPPPPSY